VDQVLYKDEERQNIYKKTRTRIVTALVVISLVQVPLQINYYYVYPKNSFLEYYALLIENVTFVSMMLMVVQFTTIVLILRQRYKHVNKCFDFHSDVWREGTKSSAKNNLLLANMKSCVMSSHTTKYGGHQVLELRHIYSNLHDTVQLLNSYFGVPVLTFTFWIFTSVAHSSFLCVWMIGSAIKDGKHPAEYWYMWFTGTLFWSVFCMLLVLLIGLSCQSTTEQSNNALIVVENLMLRCGLRCETVNELRVLSLQLNNMKVYFTAGGFFTLDLPFVHSFVCMICTYFVVQLQFQ
jgi:hypothetical protein